MVSLAAPHAKGKKSNDVIFGASAAAKADIQKIGAEHVVNATIGTILDDDEKIVCLPVVERVFKSLPMADIISYAPIALPSTWKMHRPSALAAIVRMPIRQPFRQLAEPAASIMLSITTHPPAMKS